MQNNFLVSIIVPIYNTSKYIDRCIKSLVLQTYKNIEIILIDDGSSDDSLLKCKKWVKKDSRIIVFHKKNGGLSSARNYGITHSNGKYISFVDSDDYVDNTFIEVLVYYLEKENVDVSMCGIKKIYSYKNVVDKKESMIDNIKLDSKGFLKYINCSNSYESFVWNKLYKKNIFENLKFDEDISMNEDTLFCVMLASMKPTFYYIDYKLYNYCVRNDSMSRNVFDEKKMTGVKSFNMIINLCDMYFPECKNGFILKKIKSLIWFKSSTIQRKYLKILNYELKKSSLIRNLYLNKSVSFKQKVLLFFRNKLSFLIYFKNHR